MKLDTVEKATIAHKIIHQENVNIDDIEILCGKGNGTYKYLCGIDKTIADKYVNYCALRGDR